MLGGDAVATRRMLSDTAIISNYIGEVNDTEVTQETVLRYCSCQTADGVILNTKGRAPADTASLYIFDHTTKAFSPDGKPRKYIPFQEWSRLEDKTGFWTISDEGRDRFWNVKDGRKYLVKSFSHLVAGSRRMHHFEVSAK